jgi:hypothetical protein
MGLIEREPMDAPASRRAVRGASNRGYSAAVAPEALGREIGKGGAGPEISDGPWYAPKALGRGIGNGDSMSEVSDKSRCADGRSAAASRRADS